MEGRVVLITGAANGIGLEIAKTMAQAGGRIWMLDLNEAEVVSQAQLLKLQGLEVAGVGCDVTDEQQLGAIIDEVIETAGRLDILVNNAGKQYVSSIDEFPSDQFELMVKLMLTAPFYAIKRVLPVMRNQRYGRIINMASINGLVGFAGKAAYNSAKHGLIGLTKVAALEVASQGITVNAVCPGYVDTPLVRRQLADLARTRNVAVEDVLAEVIYPLVPQRRLLEVQEIADYVLYLAGERAKGITGQAVVIDGGYTSQ